MDNLRGFFNPNEAGATLCEDVKQNQKRASRRKKKSKSQTKREVKYLLVKARIKCGLTELNTLDFYQHIAKSQGLESMATSWNKRKKVLTAFLGIELVKPKYSSQSREKFNAFYDSTAWRRLRYRVLKDQPHECACCGSIKKPFHVDHIKPRFKHPSLELEYSNLQVLCADCNMGKGGWDETDWRTT